MNCSDSTARHAEVAPGDGGAITVFVREAGLPFQPPLGSAPETDPFAQWLSLMEVVQMLCPTWPVRDTPMQGTSWRI
jgi:hypothetical protein